MSCFSLYEVTIGEKASGVSFEVKEKLESES